jgi:hypothetical protein
MDAPFHDADSFFAWLASLAQWELDVILDHRGPKGRGKSNGMFYIMLRVDPKLTPQEAFLFLCYNKEQYAKVYRAVREQRRAESVRPKFIWGDDADQLFDRRAHGTLGNRAMLGLVRKARDQLRAIQQLGTQDDFLEGPLLAGGLFVRLIYKVPGEARVYWPRRSEMLDGEVKWDYVFTLVFPDPKTAYPESWKAYQLERRRLTSDGTEELLAVIDPDGAERQASNPTLKDAIVAECQAYPAGKTTEIVARLRAKGVQVTYNYARLVRQGIMPTPAPNGTDKHGSTAASPGQPAGATS